MPARILVVVSLALAMALGTLPARAADRQQVEVLVQYYADYYQVPRSLVRRVVNRESGFNPGARNGPYWGLMQIRHDTARTMGYRGNAAGLLDAETNLIYAVKYLRGAYLVADGNPDRAVSLYASGYYYRAKAKGLLEETGLRPGPNSPATPAPGTATPAQTAIAEATTVDSITTGSIGEASEATAPVAVALGFLPPERPENLEVALDPVGASQPEGDMAALEAGVLRGTFATLGSQARQLEPEAPRARPLSVTPPPRPEGL